MAHAAFAALARASHCVTGEGRHFASGSSPRVACARPHPLSTSKSGAGRGELAVAAAAPLPAALSVRLDLARSLGRLDLSDSGLEELPEEVLELTSLEELSLSGNRLEELPDGISRLTALRKLGLAGNRLRRIPDSIGALRHLEGLWLHGNCLAVLPETVGSLTSLQAVNLSGNFLQQIPSSLARLPRLDSLGLAGNDLASLPDDFGSLGALSALSLHGNRLWSLPATFGALKNLQSVSLQGNALGHLPDDLSGLTSLTSLNVADNDALASLPPSLFTLPSLASVVAYGCRIRDVPPHTLAAPALRYLWLEGNPLSPQALAALAPSTPPTRALKAVGLDSSQAAGLGPNGLPPHVRVSSLIQAPSGMRHGYLKITPAPGLAPGAPGTGRALVVAFGSAPGDPNWGGVLSRVRGQMEARGAPGADFDVMFVVDARRCWYDGAGGGLEHYRGAVERAVREGGYRGAVLLGDSMGASAALMLADLARSVLAFTPQVDLSSCSIRPGRDQAWLSKLREVVRSSVGRAVEAGVDVRVLTGSWQHDLDQARQLEDIPGVQVKVFSLDSHRLAHYLDSQGRLAAIVEEGIAAALGMRSPTAVRLTNLL